MTSSKRRARRAHHALLTLALVVSVSPLARAEPPENQVRVGATPLALGFFDLPDGYFSRKGVPALVAEVGYSRRILRGLDLGVRALVERPFSGDVTMLAPVLEARGFLDFRDRTLELGGSLSVGPSLVLLRAPGATGDFLGGLLGAGLDVTLWPSETVGIRVGPEALAGSASPRAGSGPAVGEAHGASILTVALALRAGAIFSF